MPSFLFIKFSLLYFVYFALLGVMAPYLGLYLEMEGFSLFEIGQLMSIMMMTKMIAPLIWGTLADKYNKSIFLVRVGAIMTLVCYVGFFWAHSFWSLALIIFFYSFFWNAVLPQIEVLTLYNLAEQRNRYSRIRLWGSIGFIISVTLCGWLFDKWGVSRFPWVLLFIIASIFLVSLLKYQEVDDQHIKHAGAISFYSQLKKPWIILFFVVSFLLQISHGAYYTYFSIYLSSLGYSKVEIGWLWALGVIAEVLIFVWMHRWLKRISIEGIMLVSLCFTAIRWLMTGYYADSKLIMVLMQCLHAFSFGAMHVASIHFVHGNFAQYNQGRAQALYSSVGFGAGGALGAYLSAFVVMKLEYAGAFLVCSLISILAVSLILVMRYRYPARIR